MAKRKRAWEPPEFEHSLHGPIPVEVVENLVDEEGKACEGIAHVYDRTIRLKSELPDLAMRIALIHEWGHMLLRDSGF
jgi:hypothetical protein